MMQRNIIKINLTKNPTGYCHVNLYRIPEEDLKEEYRSK